MRFIYILLLGIVALCARAESPPNTPDGLWEALEHYDIHHKEIVYAQAILETGHFKYVYKNNIFGLRGKRYYKYNSWSDCVKAYKEKIQSRYKQGEDYYKFLKRIHYATDPKYIRKLKKIVNGKNSRTRESGKGNK